MNTADTNTLTDDPLRRADSGPYLVAVDNSGRLLHESTFFKDGEITWASIAFKRALRIAGPDKATDRFLWLLGLPRVSRIGVRHYSLEGYSKRHEIAWMKWHWENAVPIPDGCVAAVSHYKDHRYVVRLFREFNAVDENELGGDA